MNDAHRPTGLSGSPRFAPKVARRDFLGLAALWSFLISGVTMFLGLFRLPMPSLFPERGSKFRIGRADRFPPGSKTVIHDRNVVIGHDEVGIYALSLVCTHLGCITQTTSEGAFTCPCHGSRFDSAGRVVQGPAPSPLRYLEMSVSPSGDLLVDKAKPVDEVNRIRPGDVS